MADASEKKTGRKSNLPRDEHGNIIPGPGRPKGVQNKQTIAMQEMVSGAMDAAGERVHIELRQRIARRKKKEPTPMEQIMLDLPPAAAYLLKQAETNPAQFLQLAKQLMPTKIDVDVTLKADALMEMVAQRRKELSEMKQAVIDGVATEVDDDE